jgi:oligoendopeptidase F
MQRTGVATAVILLVLLVGVQTHSADFEPIPEAMKELYSFDLEKNFYADEAGFQADLGALTRDVEELESLKGKVSASAANLYRAYELSEKVIPTWWKLWVYAYLRYATNTDDLEYLETIEKTSGDLEGRIQFVKTETQDMDEATLERFFEARPELREYGFAIEEARRYLPYTLSLPEEEIIATMSPYLGGWSEKLYQKLIDRTDFPDMVVDGDTFDVNLNYSFLINSNDRQVRKDTWTSYFESMADQRDLYAFTLIKAIETRDKIAQVKGFRNYPDSKFFDLYLDYDDVAAYFDEIARHAHLRKAYEKVRRARIMADTGYDTVYIWDRQVQAGDFEKPRFGIKRATEIIMTAMRPVGDEYQAGLERLLDPKNRLLDIVSGEKRVSGMFATSYPGGTSQFFSQTYDGYLTEVNGLAHESGHAVHHMMQNAAGVRPIYYDGASYLTESVAMTSELLLNVYLYEKETDLATKAYYLEQFLENALGLLTNNMFAHLEFKIYEGIEDGSIKDADNLDTISFDMTTPYSMYYGNHPQYKTLWAVIHHYYDVPMYNINYVIAQALSLVFFDKILNEPGFVDKYQAMLRSDFSRPTPDVIKETTGVYMLDPTLLASGFAFLEEKTEELRQIYAQLGIDVE